ncbi:hypothetical protein ABA45_10360 [Marinobacter psychrophilus]|uniref:Uncharacterized protein n=1 Tax=Marinobacter psychrophilus TaxID=330734 RepID=A0A0H4ICK0_9GAMM|nr:hypothetical protein [Marinobacter psychrophilus]AKO52757.1 hypothetical protein ABA45_10360 [Marinobacter psychrophilus]
MNYHRHFVLVSAALICLGIASKSTGEILFEETFDSQPDFTSTMHTTSQPQFANLGAVIPDGWYGLYQSTWWSPEKGLPFKHASMEILASNIEKTRNGTGKAMVNWRESYVTGGGYAFNSDSQLIKYLGQEYDELYVEFWIAFSPNWWQRTVGNEANWQSKIFRVGSWSQSGDIESGINGDIGPLYLWDYKKDAYGVRNFFSVRGGPWGANYAFPSGSYTSEQSLNYTSSTKGMAVGGGDPQVLDQVSGGFLANFGGATSHDQVFGAAGHWTKMGFHVKKNSAIGAADGTLSVFINDERIVHRTNIPWVEDNGTGVHPGWNYFAIGGNDYFAPFPNKDQFEDWYSIDDIVVRSDLPTDLSTGVKLGYEPMPPGNLEVK